MELIWYFLFYSALGFVLEVAFTWATGGEKRDRKCMLFLPLCPVYGVGALGILLLPEWIQVRPMALFLAGGLAATAAEYLLSWFYETAWGVSFWDYRHLPLHINGRVCLPFSLAWGLLSFPLCYFVQPVAARIALALPTGLIAALGLLFLLDLFLTGEVLRRSHTTDALRWWVKAPLADPVRLGSAPPSLRAFGQRRSPDPPSSP